MIRAYEQGYPTEPNIPGQGFSGRVGSFSRMSVTARRYCSSADSRWRGRARHASAITIVVDIEIASAKIQSTSVSIICQMMARLRSSRTFERTSTAARSSEGTEGAQNGVTAITTGLGWTKAAEYVVVPVLQHQSLDCHGQSEGSLALFTLTRGCPPVANPFMRRIRRKL